MHTLLVYAQKTISMFPKSLQSDMTTSIRHVKWSCKNDKKIVLKCTSFDEFCPTASFYWMENFWILFQRWWIAHLAEMQFSPLCSFKLLHFGNCSLCQQFSIFSNSFSLQQYFLGSKKFISICSSSVRGFRSPHLSTCQKFSMFCQTPIHASNTRGGH